MTARADRGLGRRLAGQFFQAGEITEVEPVAARMRRITLAVPELDWTPGQQVRVCVGDVSSPSSWLDGMRRTYSVWSHDAGRLSLCLLDHGGDGPGSRWARAVRPGQEVLFSRPEGNLVARPAEVHVFAGEETAAVAFGAMIAALGDADVRGVIEVGEPGDWLPRPDGRPWPDGIVWRYRDGAPATMSPTLAEAVADLDLPPEPGAAYVAGEAHTVQAVARHLVTERGWPRRGVRTKPFWSPGRTGLD